MFLFLAPVIAFEEVTYGVNENKEVKAVLVLTGLSSINITVHIGTINGSAIGKHIILRSFYHNNIQMIFIKFNFLKGFCLLNIVILELKDHKIITIKHLL